MDHCLAYNSSRLNSVTIAPNIFINVPFLLTENTEVCNFTDDNTAYKCSPQVAKTLRLIEKDTMTEKASVYDFKKKFKTL